MVSDDIIGVQTQCKMISFKKLGISIVHLMILYPSFVYIISISIASRKGIALRAMSWLEVDLV